MTNTWTVTIRNAAFALAAALMVIMVLLFTFITVYDWLQDSQCDRQCEITQAAEDYGHIVLECNRVLQNIQARYTSAVTCTSRLVQTFFPEPSPIYYSGY